MAKVPYVPVTQVQPSGQPLPYLSDAGANPDAFGADIGRAMQGLGNELQRQAEIYTERQKKAEKLRTERDFTNFAAEQDARYEELARSAPETGNGFATATMADYDEAAERWLTDNVPEELKDEYALRLEQYRRGRGNVALENEYRLQDNFARTTIQEKADEGRLYLDQHPEAVDDYRTLLETMVDESTLPDEQKSAMKKAAAQALEEVAYTAGVRDGKIPAGALGVGGFGSVVDKIIGAESSGNPTARNPRSTARGLGQFINSTWDAFLTARHPELKGPGQNALKDDPALSREATEWYAGQNAAVLRGAGLPPTDANIYAMHFLGPGGGLALLRAPDDAMVSGVLDPGQIRANATVLAGKSVGEVKAWLNRKMGPGTSAPIADPRFANVPYERRMALYDDAQRMAAQRAVQQAAEAKAIYENQLNTLALGLHDGNKGLADIMTARQDGWLTDYDAINKLEGIVAARQRKTEDLSAAIAKYSDNVYPWNPNSSEDKKSANLMFEATGGADRLAQRDDQYVQEGLIPMISGNRPLPSDAIGVLEGMTRTPDSQVMNWSFSQLDLLERSNPRGFGSDVPEGLQKDLKVWRELSTRYPEEEIAARMQEFRDPRKIAARKASDESAAKILAENYSPADITGHFDTLFGLEPTPPTGPLGFEMWDDFQHFFKEELFLTGSEERAKENALKDLEKNGWGVTEIGGSKRVTKYAPEQFYPQVDNSHDWMREQADTELTPLLPEGAGYNLIRDEETDKEIRAKTPPSWAVTYLDEFGRPNVLFGEDGKPQRFYFDEKPALEKLRERLAKEAERRAKEEADLKETQRQMWNFEQSGDLGPLEKQMQEAAPPKTSGPGIRVPRPPIQYKEPTSPRGVR